MNWPFQEESYNKRGTCSGNQANMKHVLGFSDQFMEAHRQIAEMNQKERERLAKLAADKLQ